MALTTGQNETDFASIEKEPFLPTLIVFQSQTQGSLCNVSKSQTHVGSDRRGLPVNLCLKKCEFLPLSIQLQCPLASHTWHFPCTTIKSSFSRATNHLNSNFDRTEVKSSFVYIEI